MRSLTRTVVVGALALPLALAGAGLATANPGDEPHHHSGHHVFFSVWDLDLNTINAGVINSNSNNGVAGQKH